MNIISVRELNKTFGIEPVLENVSFTVNKGDRVGVVGPNGAGKSTLFKIIVGELAADSGEIATARDLTVGYLKQREHFPERNAVLDTLLMLGAEPAAKRGSLAGSTLAERFEELHGYSFERAAKGILISLGFAESMFGQAVGSLSGGEKTRLALGAMLLREPDLMLLDEPTNHLDIPTLKWLEGYLKGYRGTLMIISHDRYFLDRCVGRIFEIEGCRLKCYEGNYTKYKETKALQYEIDLKHYQQQMEEIKRQEELIARYKGRGTEKLAKRAHSREMRLSHMEKPERPVMLSESLKMNFQEKLISGNDVVFAEGLSFAYPGAGGSNTAQSGAAEPAPLFQNVSLDIKKQDRICLVGANGIGKTTLLKIILGQIRPDTGYVRLGQNVIPGYYDQEQRGLDPESTVLDELHRMYFKYDQTDLRKILGSFLFRGDDVFKKVGDLAGGEKARLALLKLMMSGANLLIFDEPTNHLDIAAKEVFEEAIMHFPGTVLIVSHDRYLLQHVPTAILELTAGGIIKYPGQYDYYEEKHDRGTVLCHENGEAEGVSDQNGKNTENAVNSGGSGAATESRLQGAEAFRAKKQADAAARKAAKRLAEAEEAVARAEDAVRRLENELCRPEIFGDASKAAETAKALEEAKKALDDAYWNWMELQ